MLNCLLPSCSCIAFGTSSAFAHWTACGERPRYLYTASSSGNCGSSLYVLRDTPHARVSVSYVLEASLLNDRVQTEVRREISWKRTRTRASLRASIAQGLKTLVNAIFATTHFYWASTTRGCKLFVLASSRPTATRSLSPSHILTFSPSLQLESATFTPLP